MKKLLGVTLGIMTALGGFVDIGQIVFTLQAGAPGIRRPRAPGVGRVPRLRRYAGAARQSGTTRAAGGIPSVTRGMAIVERRTFLGALAGAMSGR